MSKLPHHSGNSNASAHLRQIIIVVPSAILELGSSWKLVGVGASVCVGDRRNLYDGRGGTILREGARDSRHVMVHVEWGHRRITCGSDVGSTCLSTL